MPEHISDLVKFKLSRSNMGVKCPRSIPSRKKKTKTGLIPIEIQFPQACWNLPCGWNHLLGTRQTSSAHAQTGLLDGRENVATMSLGKM